MSHLYEGSFKIYKSFDSKIFEKVSTTEISSAITSKCWNDLKIFSIEPITLFEFYNWIQNKKINEKVTLKRLSKIRRQSYLTNLFEETLEQILEKNDFFDFIDVTIAKFIGTQI